MKTTIIALAATALIAAVPAVPARDVSSKTPGQHHRVLKKHPHRVVSGYVPWHAAHAKSVKMGYPGAFGYAPTEPQNYRPDQGSQAGGGGGGGGGM